MSFRSDTPGLDLQSYSPEEIRALVRVADSEQDAAIYLAAAFTGLRRGEVVALRWREVHCTASTLPGRRLLRRRCSDDAEANPTHRRIAAVPTYSRSRRP